MNKKINWEKTIEQIQEIMLWLVVGFTAISILAFVFFDAVAGTGIMFFLTRGNLVVSIGISLATSGLLNVLMLLTYIMSKSKNQTIGKVVLVIAGLFYVVDIVFDSLTADILAYGRVVSTGEMVVSWLHWMYRILIGGLSSFGDALGFATILGLTTLKEIFNDVLKTKQNSKPPSSAWPSGKINRDIAERLPKAKQPEVDLEDGFLDTLNLRSLSRAKR